MRDVPKKSKSMIENTANPPCMKASHVSVFAVATAVATADASASSHSARVMPTIATRTQMATSRENAANGDVFDCCAGAGAGAGAVGAGARSGTTAVATAGCALIVVVVCFLGKHAAAPPIYGQASFQ